MGSRPKAWHLTKLTPHVAYPEVDDNEFKVQINVTIDAHPNRTIFGRITPDEADLIAKVLQERAAEARRRTADF